MRRTAIVLLAMLALVAGACSLSFGDDGGNAGAGMTSSASSAEPLDPGKEPVAADVSGAGKL